MPLLQKIPAGSAKAYSLFSALYALLLFAANPFTSYAQVSVDNVIVQFPFGKRPVQNVIVGNSSDKTAYVLVEVESIVNPASDPGKSAPTTELLVSPKAFSIEPHGQRSVRLLLKSEPGELEKVFRVGFVPQDRGFGEEVSQTKEGRTTMIRVLTGMGILVFADPKKPEAKLEWTRTEKEVVFTNRGTIQVYIDDVKSCSTGENCAHLPSKRIYAGAEYRLIAPRSNVISFLERDGVSGEPQKVTIDPK